MLQEALNVVHLKTIDLKALLYYNAISLNYYGCEIMLIDDVIIEHKEKIHEAFGAFCDIAAELGFDFVGENQLTMHHRDGSRHNIRFNVTLRPTRDRPTS